MAKNNKNKQGKSVEITTIIDDNVYEPNKNRNLKKHYFVHDSKVWVCGYDDFLDYRHDLDKLLEVSELVKKHVDI